ncbi:MATE family efflux transporter [Desulforhopalus singaporensis]|uniref:Multidrug-efflux transporter n=1 Tax=Desulforhopalus singaporensis TaxID=91360 RepID=A0A1H0UGY2_9BACT|nr:MATE family efflux transporter [Desulforhopalus singaporensis]SDP65411.1 multidrug resistance protein, MATE family [Desulforhopalus singaporensis]
MLFYLQKLITKNRYREVLRVCLPLVLSLSATTIMEFTDRIFLANYSIDAISAALPAGITSYLFLAFFGGIGGYVGVFIAQYTGSGEHRKIGSILWQGIYFSIFSGIFIALVALLATDQIFSLAGHPPEVQELEKIYFTVLSYGSVLHLSMVTLATFFSGRGITRPVMIITFIGVIINIPLDYALIFGKWGMAEMGIKGAALATVGAWAVNVILLLLLLFTRKNNQQFGVLSNFYFRPKLTARLLRFGVPGSVQFTMDILAFTFFILLVGRIGKAELAATNIVLSINSLAFMPSMGASQGVSVLVGQALGSNSPAQASACVRGSSQLLLFYILLVDLFFLFTPDLILAPFLQNYHGTGAEGEVLYHARVLLKIVAAYLFFDALYMIFSGALRGAGDTRFMMIAGCCLSPLLLILPVYLGVEFYHISITAAWCWVLVFVASLFTASALRYQSGRWKKMLVIDHSK